jgi:hypothetical protein
MLLMRVLVTIVISLLAVSHIQYLRNQSTFDTRDERLRPDASIPHSCHVSEVYRTRAITRVDSLTRVPWLQMMPSSAGVVGYLFYSIPAPATRYTVLETNGQVVHRNTKILWVLGKRNGSSTLTVRGSQVYGTAHFQQLFAEAVSPPANYPSIIRVPVAGCWKITVRSGAATASAVMWVRPANPKSD